MQNIIINEDNFGLPPGTPVYIGDRPPRAMDISIITYNSSMAETRKISSADEIPRDENDKIMWINIIGLKDIDSIKNLAKMYDIHTLTIEDILNVRQQPKVESFEHYRFVSFKSIRQEKKFNHGKKKQISGTEEFLMEQISMIIMKDVIITIQEVPGDPFDGIRKRIMENVGRVRKLNADYLAYSLIDSVVDEYYLTLAHLGEDIEMFEDAAVNTSNDNFISEIQDTKKYLFQLKRLMLPLRDNIINLTKYNEQFASKELKPFLQDLHENINSAIELVEHYREWLTNIMDVNLSVLSYQLNKVMKILAVISAIFIPLTFIAGIYGMNFQFMPELGQPLGYPIVLGGMGLIALTMAIIFKLRKWF